jgi:tRNA U34 5-methylaminomethyl-2-thiouridine-forming methyltransferase MnmC
MTVLQDMLVTTQDGSLSLREPLLDELYHNRAGAYTEAQANYVEPSLALNAADHLEILDSCFGLGYNSLVLAKRLRAQGRSARFHCVELYGDVLDLLPQILDQEVFADLAQDAELSLSDHRRTLTFSTIQCEIYQQDLRQFVQHASGRNSCFDLVFHDPFSPRKVPELWTIDLFAGYKELLKEGGAVLTYTCSPAVRGAFEDLGFSIYRTAAVGGKKGGTAAVKGKLSDTALASGLFGNIDCEGLRRLSTSSRVPYRDPILCFNRQEIQANRLTEQLEFNRVRGRKSGR